MPNLLDPIQVGAILAPNRIFMAPMTRGRADRDAIPTATMKEYYTQRASAGLIIAEATGVSPQGLGWPFAPGLWNDAQVEGWKPINDAVHEAGGRIVAQLWHMGRVNHPNFLGGGLPVSSSATLAPGHSHTYEGKSPFVTSRPLELDEIRNVVEDYAQAARNAIRAGFDGIQLHAANGYLIDQFLRDNCNFRDDIYGGSIENRMRFLIETVSAIGDFIGYDRVSVRLSPNGDTQGVDDSDPETLFTTIASVLGSLNIGFIELREPDDKGTYGRTEVPRLSPAIRKAYNGVLVTNSDRTQAEAQAELDAGICDAVSFGRPFIGNPDLPERFASGAELVDCNPATFFSSGPEGYTNFPALEKA